MSITTVMLGSIGVLADTSEMQREAFNQAFDDHGLDWHWDKSTYQALLRKSGGKNRIAQWAEAHDADVDVNAIYESKVTVFEQRASAGLQLRPGVAELIADAKEQGLTLAFVSSSDVRQVNLILEGLKNQIAEDTFDYIGHGLRVSRGKPAPDIYLDALSSLGVSAQNCVAVEDTPESAAASLAAGIYTFGFPNEMNAGRKFPTGMVCGLPAFAAPHDHQAA